MLDFVCFVVFMVLFVILFKKYFIPILKEEKAQAIIRTHKLCLKESVLELEKEKLELEIDKLKG